MSRARHLPRRRGHALALAAALLSASTVVGAGCSSGEDPTSIEVSDAWARQDAEVANQANVYLELVADGDDVLVEAAVPDDVAGGAELRDPDATDGIDLAEGQTTTLEPDGPHILLNDLRASLEAGSSFELTLTFESGATETVTTEVRDD